MKWEYLVIKLAFIDNAINEAALKRAGSGEWELVSVDNSIAYFKRPNQEYLAYLESESKIVKGRHSS